MLAQKLTRQNPLNELHTRPWELLSSPFVAYHYALINYDKVKFVQKVNQFIAPYGKTISDANNFYVSVDCGLFLLNYECHTEFIGMSLIAKTEVGQKLISVTQESGQINPFQAWLKDLPAEMITAIKIEVVKDSFPDTIDELQIDSNYPIGSLIANKAGHLMANFRQDDQGLFIFKIIDFSLTPGQLGRLIQRIHEIVDYSALALLALGFARSTTPILNQYEEALSEISNEMAKEQDLSLLTKQDSIKQADHLMNWLNQTSAGIEKMVATNSYRFSAATAYQSLVASRIEGLREFKLASQQTIYAFMQRRFSPAMRYVESVDERQIRLAERSRRIGALMRTTIDHALQAQNASLLESVNQRMILQLQLQRMVEGLSIIAISYYMAGLIGYLATALGSLAILEHYEIHIDGKMVTGFSIPFIMVAIWLFLKRLHRRISKKYPKGS